MSEPFGVQEANLQRAGLQIDDLQIVDPIGVGGPPTVPPPPESYGFHPDKFGTSMRRDWGPHNYGVLEAFNTSKSPATRLVLIGDIIEKAKRDGIPEGIHLYDFKTGGDGKIVIASKEEDDELVRQLNEGHITPDELLIQLTSI